MAYIDESYLQDAFGAAQVTAMCATAGELSVTIDNAQAEVHAAVWAAGYKNSAPGDYTPATCPPALKLAAYGAWLEAAHLRQLKDMPPEARAYVYKIELIRTGKLEILDTAGVPVSKNTVRAVGGVASTDVTSTVASGGRPPVFSRADFEGF